MRFKDRQVRQQRRHRLGRHRGTPVRVDGQRRGAAVKPDRLGHEVFRQLAQLRSVHLEMNSAPGENINHHVQVVIRAPLRARQLGNVPRPHLVRPGGHELGFRTSRMGGLRTALADLPGLAEQPVHRGDRGQVDALIDQDRPDLPRGLAGEPGTVQDGKQLLPLAGGQRVRRGRPPLPAPGPDAMAPAVNRGT